MVCRQIEQIEFTFFCSENLVVRMDGVESRRSHSEPFGCECHGDLSPIETIAHPLAARITSGLLTIRELPSSIR
jgi:hypothetical protein